MSMLILPRDNILIVDDSPYVLNLTRKILQDEYHILMAENGQEALNIAHSSPSPDIILLDIMMPEMDGYEICRRLKESDETKHIPIIFLTAVTSEDDEVLGLSLGAIDYITKPFSASILQARVRNSLERKKIKDLYKKGEEALKAREAQLSFIVDNINDAIFELDIEAKYTYVSPSHLKILGRGEELIGRKALEFLHPDDSESTKEVIRKSYQTGKTLKHICRYLHPEKGYIWMETIGGRQILEDGKLKAIHASRDISDRKIAEQELEYKNEKLRATNEQLLAIEEDLRYQYERLFDMQKALKKSEEQYRNLVENIRDIIIEVDSIGNIVFVSNKIEELLGYKADEIKEKNILTFIHEDDKKSLLDNFTKISTIIEKANSDYRVLSANGEYRWYRVRSVAIIEGNTFCGARGILIDIQEQKAHEDEIIYLSFHDHLTGLYNRRFFEEELKRLDIKRNLPITLLMADVNGLKLTNDAFGHLVGDKLLQKAAEVLKNTCREDDIVARIGGDEFVILLPHTDSLATGMIVERLRSSMLIEKTDIIPLSISFGWSTKSLAEQNISEILKQAEDLMYRQKLSESNSNKNKTLKIIMQSVFDKNEREEIHAKRVSELSVAIGKQLGLSEEDIKELKTLGLMHDIGKITIADEILNNPNALNDFSWEEIKRHTETGYRILSSVNEFAQLAEYVLAHHERWDGQGYPKGLKNIEIPLPARIISIADAYEAMTSERPFRQAFNEDFAIMEIKNNAGKQFDPEICKIFLSKVLGNSK